MPMIQTLPNWRKLRLEFTLSPSKKQDVKTMLITSLTKLIGYKNKDSSKEATWIWTNDQLIHWILIYNLHYQFFIFLQDYKYLTDEGVFIHELKYYLPGEHCVDIIMKDAAEDDYEYDYENSYVFDDDKEINQTNSDYSLVVLFCFAEGKDIEDCLKTSTVGPDSEEGPEDIAREAITSMDVATEEIILSVREKKSFTRQEEEFDTKESNSSGEIHLPKEDKRSVKRPVSLSSIQDLETVNSQIRLSCDFIIICMIIVLSLNLNIF